jgi:hypothetical protein
VTAVVGEGQDGKTGGGYGLGRRNDRGERLGEFCMQNGLYVTNSILESAMKKIHMENARRHMEIPKLLHMYL